MKDQSLRARFLRLYGHEFKEPSYCSCGAHQHCTVDVQVFLHRHTCIECGAFVDFCPTPDILAEIPIVRREP